MKKEGKKQNKTKKKAEGGGRKRKEKKGGCSLRKTVQRGLLNTPLNYHTQPFSFFHTLHQKKAKGVFRWPKQRKVLDQKKNK